MLTAVRRLDPPVTLAARRVGLPRRWRLRGEFALFYLVAPVVGAVLLPPDAMFGLLFAMTGLGLVLLHHTPGFAWADLATGWGRIDWTRVAAIATLTALAGYAVIRLTAPEALDPLAGVLRGAASAEIHAADVAWPDFREAALHEALRDYAARDRRYGKPSEQLA